MKQLRYIDHRPIKMNLRNGGWVGLPNSKTGNIINVTDDEARALLKRTNGSRPCFEVVHSAPAPRARRSEAVEDGNR